MVSLSLSLSPSRLSCPPPRPPLPPHPHHQRLPPPFPSPGGHRHRSRASTSGSGPSNNGPNLPSSATIALSAGAVAGVSAGVGALLASRNKGETLSEHREELEALKRLHRDVLDEVLLLRGPAPHLTSPFGSKSGPRSDLATSPSLAGPLRWSGEIAVCAAVQPDASTTPFAPASEQATPRQPGPWRATDGFGRGATSPGGTDLSSSPPSSASASSPTSLTPKNRTTTTTTTSSPPTLAALAADEGLGTSSALRLRLDTGESERLPASAQVTLTGSYLDPTLLLEKVLLRVRLWGKERADGVTLHVGPRGCDAGDMAPAPLVAPDTGLTNMSRHGSPGHQLADGSGVGLEVAKTGVKWLGQVSATVAYLTKNNQNDTEEITTEDRTRFSSSPGKSLFSPEKGTSPAEATGSPVLLPNSGSMTNMDQANNNNNNNNQRYMNSIMLPVATCTSLLAQMRVRPSDRVSAAIYSLLQRGDGGDFSSVSKMADAWVRPLVSVPGARGPGAGKTGVIRSRVGGAFAASTKDGGLQMSAFAALVGDHACRVARVRDCVEWGFKMIRPVGSGTGVNGRDDHVTLAVARRRPPMVCMDEVVAEDLPDRWTAELSLTRRLPGAVIFTPGLVLFSYDDASPAQPTHVRNMGAVLCGGLEWRF